MKPLRLSRSKVDLFIQCPKCFWLNINKNSAILGYKSGGNEYTELVKDISYNDFNVLKIKP